jgi:hypothetical protein
MSLTTSRKHSGFSLLHLLVGLLAAGVSIPAFAQSNPYPTYVVGANQNGTQGPNYPLTTTYPWVAGDGALPRFAPDDVSGVYREGFSRCQNAIE